MMMDDQQLDVLKHILPYAFGGGAAYWVKRWISKTDATIEKLLAQVQEINIKLAVAAEQRLARDEIIAEIKERLEQTETQMKESTSAIVSFWTLLKSKGMICEESFKKPFRYQRE